MITFIELDEGDWVRADAITGITTVPATGRAGRTILGNVKVLAGGERFTTSLTADEVLERLDYAIRKTQDPDYEVSQRDTEGDVANTLADEGSADGAVGSETGVEDGTVVIDGTTYPH